jgi:molybdopterin converting factor small subunit
MPHVVIPPPYRGPTGGLGQIEVDGVTVRECIEAVGERYPGFVEQVLDADGRVHRFVNLFVNGEEIERAAVDAPVAAGDHVEILAAIAGGSAPGARGRRSGGSGRTRERLLWYSQPSQAKEET